MFSDLQECTRCGGMIGRDGFVQITDSDGLFCDTLLHCSFCRLGVYASWHNVEGDWRLIGRQVEVQASTEPESYARFLRDFEKKRSAKRRRRRVA